MAERLIRASDLSPKNTDRRSLRKTYALANIFELLIGILTVLAGLTLIVQPEVLEGSSLGRFAGELVWAWNMTYLAGGLLVVSGILGLSIRLEISGLALIATASATYGIAVASVFGTEGTIAIASNAAVVIACVIRVYSVLRVIRRMERPA